MFRIAQWIVQNKVSLVAICVAFFMVFGGKKEAPKPANPWSANVEQVAVAPQDKSLTDKAIGAVAGAAKKYTGVDIGVVDPAKVQESTKENFAAAEAGMRSANGN